MTDLNNIHIQFEHTQDWNPISSTGGLEWGWTADASGVNWELGQPVQSVKHTPELPKTTKLDMFFGIFAWAHVLSIIIERGVIYDSPPPGGDPDSL